MAYFLLSSRRGDERKNNNKRLPWQSAVSAGDVLKMLEGTCSTAGDEHLVGEHLALLLGGVIHAYAWGSPEATFILPAGWAGPGVSCIWCAPAHWPHGQLAGMSPQHLCGSDQALYSAQTELFG